MKIPMTCLAVFIACASPALADIRRHHGGIQIGIGMHHGHHHHGHHHGAYRHHRHHRHAPHYGFSHGLLFSPWTFSAYSPVHYERSLPSVTRRERAPKAPRSSSLAPSWTPGSGWKTHRWYQRRPQLVTSPDSLRDARSPEQLQAIFGAQGASFAR